MPTAIVWVISVSAILIPLSVWTLLAFSVRRSKLEAAAQRRFVGLAALYFAAWVALAFALGVAGVFEADASLLTPTLAIGAGVVLPIVIGTILMNRSPSLQSVLAAVPHSWLIGIQLYRAIGITFLALYLLGHLPGEFAIPAGGGDLIVGLAAPLVGYAIYKGARGACNAAFLWNWFGILDLVVAVGTGVLSSPGPLQRLALDTPNQFITAFPLVLVPTIAVPLSILLHVISLRRLKTVAPDGALSLEVTCRENLEFSPERS